VVVKIVLLGEHPGLDGTLQIEAGHHHRPLAKALADHGHDVNVYSLTAESGAGGYQMHSWSAANTRAGEPIHDMAMLLERQWQMDRPDIVHAYCWMCGLAAQLAAKSLQIPVVQTFGSLSSLAARHHNSGDDAVRRRLEPLVARRAAWLAPLCTADMNELARLVRSRSRISLITHGVDIDQFSTEGTSCPRGEGYRIVTVARELAPEKHLERIIAVLPRISGSELLIVGGPARGDLDTSPEVAHLRDVAHRFGVGDRTHLLGSVPHSEMPGLLRGADVVVSASPYEPAETQILEAMSCGVAVVAAAVPGTQEAVVQDVTGVLIAPGDVEQLTAVLRRLGNEPFARSAMGLAGRTRARACFSWGRVAAQLETIYGRALDEFDTKLRTAS
jgi:glycosyltransferase involved in cell wall biosynthesis